MKQLICLVCIIQTHLYASYTPNQDIVKIRNLIIQKTSEIQKIQGELKDNQIQIISLTRKITDYTIRSRFSELNSPSLLYNSMVFMVESLLAYSGHYSMPADLTKECIVLSELKKAYAYLNITQKPYHELIAKRKKLELIRTELNQFYTTQNINLTHLLIEKYQIVGHSKLSDYSIQNSSYHIISHLKTVKKLRFSLRTPPLIHAPFIGGGFLISKAKNNSQKEKIWVGPSQSYISSPWSAQVIFAGMMQEGLGVIMHTNGFFLVLFGLGSVIVKTGEIVWAGEPIGRLPTHLVHANQSVSSSLIAPNLCYQFPLTLVLYNQSHKISIPTEPIG